MSNQSNERFSIIASDKSKEKNRIALLSETAKISLTCDNLCIE